MTLPAPLETVTVRGTWLSPIGGGPLVGTATLAAVNAVLSPAGDVLLTTAPTSKVLDENGSAEWTDVLASDSTGLSGTVTYRVQVYGNRYVEDRPVELLTSAAVAGVIDLADVATAVPGPAVTTYVLAATVGLAGGVAGPLDVNGLVPASQLPSGSSTPDASGTTKGVVQLTGDLSGTATAPTVPGLVGKQPIDTDLTAIAALTPTNDDILQRKSGAWTNRTIDQLTTDLALAIADVAGLQTALDAKLAGTLVDAKGDLIVATANDTSARLAVGSDGTVLVADSGQTPGVKWAARTTPAYSPTMDGLVAAAGDPALFRTQGALGTPGWAVRVPIPAGQPITGALTCVHIAGTVGAGGVNGFAVSDDSGVLVSSTVDDDTLWTTAGKRSKAFASPIAAQSTDRYVYVSIRVNGYSAAPSFSFVDGSANSQRLEGLMQTKARSFVLSGSSWGNFNPAAAPNSGGFMVFLALY